MKAQAVAQAILAYLKANKGTGNTRTVVNGAASTKANIVLLEEDVKSYRNVKPAQLVSITDVEKGLLENRSGFPLIVDNGALVAILEGLLGPAPKKAKKEKA